MEPVISRPAAEPRRRENREAEQLASAKEASPRVLADLWLAIGDREEATKHALAAYRWAWAGAASLLAAMAFDPSIAMAQRGGGHGGGGGGGGAHVGGGGGGGAHYGGGGVTYGGCRAPGLCYLHPTQPGGAGPRGDAPRSPVWPRSTQPHAILLCPSVPSVSLCV